MKIIELGSPQLPPPHWWHGKIATCGKCHCRVELEPGDDAGLGPVTVHAERRMQGKSWVQVICPTEGCDSRFELYRAIPASAA